MTNLTLSSSSSRNEPRSKKVLLFGKTGSGKSTVANALVTGGMEQTVFKSSDGPTGCTRQIQMGAGRGWEVVDTVGLGEANRGTTNTDDATKMLETFLKLVKSEYSHIIYVIKKDRLTKLDELIWEIFVKIFEGGEAGFVVLFTAADKHWLETEKDSLPSFMRTPSLPVLAIDIPPTKSGAAEKKNERIRKTSIEDLENDLDKVFRERNYEYVVPKIANMTEPELMKMAESIIDKIVAALKRLFVGDTWRNYARMIGTLINVTGLIVGAVSLA